MDHIHRPSMSELSYWTGSEAPTIMAKAWLGSCLREHSSCRKEEDVSWRNPTRLIHIGLESDQPAKLIELKNETQQIEYITLSHSWGDADILKLERNSICAMKNHIGTASLPAKFRDALDITRRLGYRYIWIDSLCIIQDSLEDWEHEAVLMSEVYSNAICNIAAVGVDSNAGCYVMRNPLSLLTCALYGGYPTSRNDLFLFVPQDYYYQNGDLLTKPFFSRGWIFQERFLSKRTIFFGAKELAWECNTCEASEIAFPEGKKHAYNTDRSPDLNAPKYALQELNSLCAGLPKSTITQPLVKNWAILVERYMALRLTNATDRLVAFAGIAQRVQQLTGLTYMVGLWKEMLLQGLLWQMRARSHRISGTGLPTWSWSSLGGGAIWLVKSPSYLERYQASLERGLPKDNHTYFAEVQETSLTKKSISSSAFTEPFSAYMRIKGLLQPIHWWREDDLHWAIPQRQRITSEASENKAYFEHALCSTPEVCAEVMIPMKILEFGKLYLYGQNKSESTNGAWYFFPDVNIADSENLHFFLIARF